VEGDPEANAERLRQEFRDLAFKPGESVEDFSLRLSTVVSQLRVLGDNIANRDVIKKLLHVVPEKLEQVAISMETLLDLDSVNRGGSWSSPRCGAEEEAAGHQRQ
jgi:hypothetical protein